MRKSKAVKVISSVLLSVAAGASLWAAPSARRPNVLFILIDDLGFGDLSILGNRDVETPALDRLVREGTLFRRFYVNSPICSPSRVAFTTGRYPARFLIHSYLASRRRNRERGMRDFLDPRAPSVARFFRQAGYATAHFGKWHMGGGRDVGDAPLPREYGFGESLVSFEGLGDRVLPPGGLSRQSASLRRGNIQFVPAHRLTPTYVDRAIAFIRRHRKGPFYVHLWLNDVHDPHVPAPEEGSLWEKKFPENPYWARFYAVLSAMDRQIGRLIDTLDGLGLGERTLVVAASDNGPTAWPFYYQRGFPPPGRTGGLRGRKWSLYEGGIRSPLIVRWKGVVPAGRVDNETVMAAVDYLPTVAGLAGVPLLNLQGDGCAMQEAFLGKVVQRRKPILFEYGRDPTYLRPFLSSDRSPNVAVIEGRWKLLVNADRSRLELYDLREDPQEAVNLAGRETSVAKRLCEKALAWRRSLPVLTTQ